jgi:hypothetical protein
MSEDNYFDKSVAPVGYIYVIVIIALIAGMLAF